MAKKGNKKNFGWTSKKSWNRNDKTHGEKLESKAYSFNLPKKKKPGKIWCAPGAPQGTIKRKGKEGRPYGYKPIYEADATLNYQSEAGRLEKASTIQPEIRIGKLLFYRASDDCYWHVVIPPDFGHDDFRDVFCEVPPDFFLLAPNEFWARYPRPNTANPGQPLFEECPPEEPDDPDDPDNPWEPEQPPRRPPRLGCTNIAANNFDPQAQIDDGSCRFDPPGEEDDDDDDDGRCRTRGCTDPEASNYNSSACYDDGSCEYPQDDPDEPEPPPVDCQNPEPSKCRNGPPDDCRWTSGSCGDGSIAPGFTVDHGFVEFEDGTRKTLCCAPSDGSGGTQTDMFWIEGSGNWSRAQGDGASPVGGAATRRGPDGSPSIGVSSARGNGLKICKHPPTHPENSKCGGLGGWRAYDNDGEIASGCGDPRISGGCDQARGDVFCNLPECQPKWKRPDGGCGCEQTYDADGYNSQESCERGITQGGRCNTGYIIKVTGPVWESSIASLLNPNYVPSALKYEFNVNGPIRHVGFTYTFSFDAYALPNGGTFYGPFDVYRMVAFVDSEEGNSLGRTYFGDGVSGNILQMYYPAELSTVNPETSWRFYPRDTGLRFDGAGGVYYQDPIFTFAVEIERADGQPDNCGCITTGPLDYR